MECKKNAYKLGKIALQLVMVILYVISGALLFAWLESPTPPLTCLIDSAELVNETCFLFVSYLSESYEIGQIDQSACYEAFKSVFANFSGGEYITNCFFDEAAWKIPSATLFAVSLISTIGYGHIAPVSQAGRGICILYSLLGIPVFLWLITTVGKQLVEPTKKLIKCTMCKNKRRVISISVVEHNQDLYRRHKRDTGTTFEFTPGLVSSLRIASKESQNNQSFEANQLEQSGHDIFQSINVQNTAEKTSTFASDSQQAISSSNFFSIKITVFLVLIFLFYWISGSLVFWTYRADWTFVDSLYFTFITLSTIGLGDLLPSSSSSTSSTNAFIAVFSIIYIFIGISLLSLCFAVISDSIVRSYKGFFKEKKNRKF